MPWVRIDEEFPHHPKVAPVGPLGIALQVASLCYSNRYLTDGYIPYGAVRTLLDFNGLGENIGDNGDTWVELNPMVIARRLVRVGMWEEVDGGFLIHDYHHYQPSRAQVEAERKKTKERVAKYRENKRKGGNKGRSPSGNAGGNAVTNSPGNGSETVAPVPVPVPPIATEGSSVADTSGSNTVVEQARPIDDTTAVFNAWKEATRKHRAQLDPKRRRRIKAALAQYPLQDVLDAVQGWQHSPHHCGQNSTGTVYNDLDLLLRDAEHLEKFRDLQRDGPPAVMGKATAQAKATYDQMRAWAGGDSGDQAGVGRDRSEAQRELPRPADGTHDRR
jgi:hypothetical protein